MLRNALNNLAGALVPALVMFVTVPVFIKGLGQADYGLFVIATSIAGYLAVLDINVNASSIKFVAESRALGDARRIGEVLGFGAGFYAAIGVIGALALLLFAEPLAVAFADGPVAAAHAPEVLRISALAFLIAQFYNFGLSVIQALERYELSSRVEIFNGIAVPVLSALLVVLGGSLAGVMWLRNAVAAISLALLLALARRLLPEVRMRWPGRALRRELLSFSAYAYLSRLAALSYQHSDKLIVGAMLGLSQVTLYTVPVLLANRILGMSYRLTQVIFPASSALLAQGEQAAVRRLMLGSMRYVTALNVMAVVGLALIGRWFLTLWLGPEFAARGTAVLVLIAAGVLVDSLTNAPSMVTDSAGRPGVTGFFAFTRALVGLAALVAGAAGWGIEGVAASHLIVAIVSALAFLAYFSRRVLPMAPAEWWREALAPACTTGLVGVVVGLLAERALAGSTTLAPLFGTAVAELAMVAVFWRLGLSAEHRASLLARLRRA